MFVNIKFKCVEKVDKLIKTSKILSVKVLYKCLGGIDMKIAIVTDSSSGLLNEEVNKDGIYVLPIPYTIEGVPYTDNQTFAEFIKEISDGKRFAKTSQVAIGVVEELYENLLKEYDYIIHLPISKGLSSTFSTAVSVASRFNDRIRVLDELTAYQMVSILQGVAVRGTGARLASLGKNLAGKTGTTNENKDAWFIGFSPDMVVGVYVGFDEPRTLGKIETGAAAALPIFYDFMKDALKNKPNYEFRVPKGIKFVRINPKTGKPATLDDKVVIYEALKPDFEFNNMQRVIGDDGVPMLEDETDREFGFGVEY